MNVYDYLNQKQYRDTSVKEKVLSKIISEAMIPWDHVQDAKQEILMAWLDNEVNPKFGDDIRTVVAFAKTIGIQACYSHKRSMTGALNIPRRVIKEHREDKKKLVTDMVDITIVKEDEVNDFKETDLVQQFLLPIQGTFYQLPMIDQNIEKDLNSGESIENVIYSSGYEKRALQSRLVNLTKADETYVHRLYEEIKADFIFNDEQPCFY